MKRLRYEIIYVCRNFLLTLPNLSWIRTLLIIRNLIFYYRKRSARITIIKKKGKGFKLLIYNELG